MIELSIVTQNLRKSSTHDSIYLGKNIEFNIVEWFAYFKNMLFQDYKVHLNYKLLLICVEWDIKWTNDYIYSNFYFENLQYFIQILYIRDFTQAQTLLALRMTLVQSKVPEHHDSDTPNPEIIALSWVWPSIL